MPSTTSVLRAAVLAGVASAASVPLAARQQTTTTCAETHIFLGKGNNEPYPGRQGKLVTAICSGLSSCDYEDIQMQNMLSDEYCGAVHEGSTNGVNQIIAYNKRCPSTKLVVSGYSQGAHVVGDIFGGGGGTYFNGCVEQSTPNLDINSPAGKQVAAILTFGDVRHTAFQPYNYLDGADKWGLYPRNSQQLANAANYASVWRDYCAGDEPICAGGNNVESHLNYFDLYTNEAAEYVQAKIRDHQGASSSSKPSVSTTSTPISTVAPSSTVKSIVTTVTSGTSTKVITTSSVEVVSSPATSASAAISTVGTAYPASSYVANPTTVTKPANYHTNSHFHTAPLPEATAPTTEVLSSTPHNTATATIPASYAASAAPTGAHPTDAPTTNDAGAAGAKLGLVIAAMAVYLLF
ncbi:carbohydrate esterase family 5 protein [Apiospora saccharicola]|uniref:Cutinase n=1 Tax=Apiospora saccharicola TaxID=335842 RepID=A0ABR1WGH7_9PEZI